MIEINLLPVRAARRRESIRLQSSVAVLTIFLVIVCIILIQANLTKREEAVDKQTASVKEEIAKLEKIVGEIEKLKEERAKLEHKHAVIKNLDKGRMRAVYTGWTEPDYTGKDMDRIPGEERKELEDYGSSIGQ